jgi:hypothetical protein
MVSRRDFLRSGAAAGLSAASLLAPSVAKATGWCSNGVCQYNVADSISGAYATASSTMNSPGSNFSAGNAINGDRSGIGWGQPNMGGWCAGAPGGLQWLDIHFNRSKYVDRVELFSVQDNFQHPVDPSDTMTFSQFGVTAGKIYGANDGSDLVYLGNFSGNNKVKCTVFLNPTTLDRIRIVITGVSSGYARLAEVQVSGLDAETPSPLVYGTYGVSAVAPLVNVPNAVVESGAGVSYSSLISAQHSAGALQAGYARNTDPLVAASATVVTRPPRAAESVIVQIVDGSWWEPIEPSDTLGSAGNFENLGGFGPVGEGPVLTPHFTTPNPNNGQAWQPFDLITAFNALPPEYQTMVLAGLITIAAAAAISGIAIAAPISWGIVPLGFQWGIPEVAIHAGAWASVVGFGVATSTLLGQLDPSGPFGQYSQGVMDGVHVFTRYLNLP